VEVSTAGAPRVTVSGRQVLVADGDVTVTDDTELHPRTAVGIDTDTGKVLLVVVDGRSESSTGYTLVQLARLMVRLGAEEALNLDGGGSSTMAVTPPGGALTVANTPSDGQQRPVPEGLGLVFTPPAG
jgi:exopolysaccharide biosynthesis protein